MFKKEAVLYISFLILFILPNFLYPQNIPQALRAPAPDEMGDEADSSEQDILKVNFLPQKCSNIRPMGSPGNVFYRYLSQTMKVFNPNDPNLQIKLIYYKENFVPTNNHRFVFKLKNNFASRWEYVGIISAVRQDPDDPSKVHHVILRYLNTTRIEDTKTLLGIDEIEDFKDNDFKCKNMKEVWLSSLMKKSYFSTNCKPTEVSGCVRASDLSALFQLNFAFLKNVLKSFGLEATIGELGFNGSILLSYRNAFSEFPFVLRALSQIEGMITPDNSVNQAILLVTADKRKKFECENMLDLKEECAKKGPGKLDCLSESQARTLLNYMVVHYMADTRTILPSETIEGNRASAASNPRNSERKVADQADYEELGQYLVN